ncbi:MAG: phosphomannomutase/phosphoglucomutase [Paracoccaceae bacterium]|nr:phosphomannomutase/phosphoglucomutase [Paracoccaceae bacterium]
MRKSLNTVVWGSAGLGGQVGNEAMDGSIFRAYDIRGIAGITLTHGVVRAIGNAFGAVVREGTDKRRTKIAVGRDGRHSSPWIESSLVDGLTRAGVDVFLIGLGPTPMLYFAENHLGCDAAVMVTGSHGPPNCNGLKFTLGCAPFSGERIRELATLARSAFQKQTRGQSRTADVSGAYVSRLLADSVSGRHLDVVWDAGNGAAGSVLHDLVAGLPGRHMILFGEVDGAFPHRGPDSAVAENLGALAASVIEHGADVGIAFDGDGDRIGVVDDEGKPVAGDELLALLAADVLCARPGATVIADVKASRVLFDEIARLGGMPLMWRTGHAPIKEKMMEIGCPLAGEVSGHMYFADRYYGFDDGLYAAVRLLNILSARRAGLASFRKSLPRAVNTPEVRIACDDGRKWVVVEEVRARLTARGADMVAIDGVRVSVAGGWWLLRASNTGPALVARCEAVDEIGLERVWRDLAVAVTPSGVELPADLEFGRGVAQLQPEIGREPDSRP